MRELVREGWLRKRPLLLMGQIAFYILVISSLRYVESVDVCVSAFLVASILIALSAPMRACTHTQVSNGLDNMVAHERCLSILILIGVAVLSSSSKILRVRRPCPLIHHDVVCVLLVLECRLLLRLRLN